MASEGFRKPYAEPSPFYAFVRTLYTLPPVSGKFYYMSLRDYTENLEAATRDAIEELGEQKVVDAILRARRDAGLKDTPLLAAEYLPSREAKARALSLYPVNKLHLYAVLAYRHAVHTTWGRSKKQAIAMALAQHPVEWHEWQAVRHRRALRSLLKLAHPKPPSSEVSAIWAWALRRRKHAPTPLIEAYMEVVRLAAMGKCEEALRAAIDARLPWEVVRSRIGGLDSLPAEIVEEAARRLMSGNDVALQARSLAKIIGAGKVAEIAHDRKISHDAAARAAIALQDEPKLFDAFYAKARVPRRVVEAEVGFEPRRIILLMDASGSMSSVATEASRLMLQLGDAADAIHMFNTIDVREVEGSDIRDKIRNYISFIDGGTPLYDSIKYVARKEDMTRDDLLIVVTDEMENASRLRRYEAANHGVP